MSIRKHTLINLTGAIIPMLVMLITVPLYIKVLGDVRYGVLALVWLMIGYFSVLEMGLGKSTANHIAKLHEAPDNERSTIFWTALLINLAFGLVASFILWGIGDYLISTVLKMPQEFRQETIEALPWIIATLPLALVSSVLTGALEGRNKFSIVNILQVVSNVIFQIVPLYAAYNYGSSLAIVIPAAVLSRSLMNIPFLIVCVKLVPLSYIPNLSFKAAKSLFSYGGWIALSGVFGPLIETLDRLIIGITLGAQAVTYYTLPYQLVTKLRIVPSSLSRSLFPKFSAADTARSNHLAQIALQTLVVVMTPIILCGIIIMYPFMHIWVGSEIATTASPIGELLLLGVWVNSLAYVPFTLLQGKGRPDLVAKFHMIEFLPFVACMWGAIHLWGLYGAVLVWVVRAFVDSTLLYLFSGMPRKSIGIISMPVIMIISAIVAAHFINEIDWRWRIGSMMIYLGWVGVWLKKGSHSNIFMQIFSYRKKVSSTS